MKQKIVMNEKTWHPEVQTVGDRIKLLSDKLLENKKIIIAGTAAGAVVGLGYVFVRSVDKAFSRAINDKQ